MTILSLFLFFLIFPLQIRAQMTWIAGSLHHFCVTFRMTKLSLETSSEIVTLIISHGQTTRTGHMITRQKVMYCEKYSDLTNSKSYGVYLTET